MMLEKDRQRGKKKQNLKKKIKAKNNEITFQLFFSNKFENVMLNRNKIGCMIHNMVHSSS